jgi:cysteinyl-tRNA synthetase
VYDHIHIGNLSAFIVADTVRRALKIAGYNTHHVMNFTDVDDKTIRRNHEQYPELPAIEALQKLTEHYSEIFLTDMQQVGNTVTDYDFVKATDPDVIEGMRQLIRELHTGGFAYTTDDGVYFSIEAYKKSGKTYGQLSTISDSSTSEERIQNDEYDKESAHDFALWKVQKDGEPAWEFELDGVDLTGRPGWHIECSVMSHQKAGQPFDIHTGGIDLIFPHHENEIAQSTAGKDDPTYAKYFVHNEHILVDGKKMSKSLNNFYTLKDVIDKGFDPLAFRLLVLQGHYRSQVHFSWENLEAAQNRLKGLQAVAVRRWQPNSGDATTPTGFLDNNRNAIQEALADDLDTPEALAILSRIEAAIDTSGINAASQAAFVGLLEWLDTAFGLQLASLPDIDDNQKQLIADREQARTTQDWAKSDELRDQLSQQGIGVRDTPQGAIWYRL